MDYKDTYDYFYQKTFLIATTKIKNTLLNGIESYRTFSTIQTNIIIEIEKKTRENSNINKYTALTNLLHFYQKKLSEYESNRIEHSLKNDVVVKYSKINKKDLPNNYTFIKFIADLGIYKAMNEANRVFRNHALLFIMMYDLKDFSEFDLKENEDNISLENTPLFVKLRLRRYPKNDVDLDLKKNNVVPRISVINTNENSDLKILNEIEKAFLFHVMCFFLNNAISTNGTSKLAMPIIELIRLNTIIDFKDGHCFDNNKYRDSINYKILNRGLDYFEKEDRISFLSELIKKLSNFKLRMFVKQLEILKNKEYNKSIKNKL